MSLVFIKEGLRHIVEHLPESAGCYLFRDSESVLYVGKAKSLRSRVKSYFQQSWKDAKTEQLKDRIEAIQFILTETEAEAFVLENHLIKKYHPKYNIRLKDDKSYPYVVLDKDEEAPTLKVLRRPSKKKHRKLFGPYPVGSRIFFTVEQVRKLFGLRECTISEFKKREVPCLLYQLKQCSGPCVSKISKEDYNERLAMAVSIFRGQGKKAWTWIHNHMLEAANHEQFELAAYYRNRLEELQFFEKTFFIRNVEFSGSQEKGDILAYDVIEGELYVVIYHLREGILVGNRSLSLVLNSFQQQQIEEGSSSLLNLVLSQLFSLYSGTHQEKSEVGAMYLELPKENKTSYEEIMKAFSEAIDLPVLALKSTYQTVYDLALQQVQQWAHIRKEGKKIYQKAVQDLQILCQTEKTFRQMECFDVANWNGESPTASCVVFINGRPEKSRYRYYHLEKRPEGQNDPEMLREAVERRIERGDLPDIFLIDGGTPQLRAIHKLLEEKNINILLVGIAKKRQENQEERLVFYGGKSLHILSKTPELWKLMSSLRDEAHRFSRKLHHHQEKKRLFAQSGEKKD
jgi:excinuclease ABC subunit C